MKLTDRSQYPLNLVMPEYNIKFNMDLDIDANKFILRINNRDYYDLPYRYDLTPEGTTCMGSSTLAQFDDRKIKVPVNWSN